MASGPGSSANEETPVILQPSQPSTSRDGEISANLVTPSDVITSDGAYMKGHGTYLEDGRLHASVAGMVQRVNKLICVKPLKTRYNGDIGDVVVGRVVLVGQNRWKMDVNSRLDAVLQLANVNLPGGELRRKSLEDELLMRDYLQEGDLVSAEVQQCYQDGSLGLQTRSLKYGKLAQGVLVKVSPSLVKRRKSHFHTLLCGVDLIMGNNGYIWISPSCVTAETGGFVLNLSEVSDDDRANVARIRNCILLLAENRCMLYDTSVQTAFDISQNWSIRELLLPHVRLAVAKEVRLQLQSEFGA